MQRHENNLSIPNIYSVVRFVGAYNCSDTSRFITLVALGDTLHKFDTSISQSIFLERFAVDKNCSVQSLINNISYLTPDIYEISVSFVEQFGGTHRSFCYTFLDRILEICDHMKSEELFQN